MTKTIKLFALFALLHVLAWGGTHFYLSKNQPEILLVVDTSYSMKPHFPAMQRWIENLEDTTRYKSIQVGTDKALLGNLSTLKSKSSIFRTAFGKMQDDNLQRYSQSSAAKKILLSDGSITPKGWQVVTF